MFLTCAEKTLPFARGSVRVTELIPVPYVSIDCDLNPDYDRGVAFDSEAGLDLRQYALLVVRAGLGLPVTAVTNSVTASYSEGLTVDPTACGQNSNPVLIDSKTRLLTADLQLGVCIINKYKTAIPSSVSLFECCNISSAKMVPLSVTLAFLLTTSCICQETEVSHDQYSQLGYDPQEILARIFSYDNSTEYRQAGYGVGNFEDNQNVNVPSNEQGYGFVNFEGQPPQNDNQNNYDNNLVSFQDQNHAPGVNQIPNSLPHQKRKKRRRKPRLQRLPGSGYGLQHPISNNVMNDPFGQSSYGYPQIPNGVYHRPPYQSKPSSLAEQAFARIASALESVARYDDYQCVPRLLCEAAGGGASKNGAAQSSLLPSVIGIQPLIMLLGAYSGISSSPLFVFGRAVFLGVTSKENNGVCRYAYPLCPTDPEKLVEYLNNYNGGFFRFFNEPSSMYPQSEFNGQASLQQFYSQLSSTPHQTQVFSNQQQNIQGPGDFSGHYGFHQSNINLPLSGLYDNRFQSGYGFPQNYGLNYPYNTYNGHYKNNKDGNSKEKIEKRIQNNPSVSFINVKQENRGEPVKWIFPESSTYTHDISENNLRTGRILKFPEETGTENHPIIANANSKTKSFTFPG
ncbi:hypothetical protein EVAR_58871_1 [Eumeta japonica]|uniref:Uncharacterized protein n=1 Tax=Eumeta variegata TaxID=151549 RepID=A0A4C1YA36_EUMVA|nr:hypothetical protein EVAR_58871_1 [Eumeta japonica]